MSGLALGIDAGDTKTVALLADAGGRVLGAGRGGRGSIYTSRRVALGELDRAVGAALETAGARPEAVGAVVLSAAGADWPEDFALLEEELSRRFARGRVVNDAFGALRAGSADGTGVAVVCGTGAATGARSGGGLEWHSSFWQEPGGAEELGRKVLRAVYRAELGLGPDTALTGLVLAHYRLDSVEALLHGHTRRGRRLPGRVGQLARPLLSAAEDGDEEACRLTLEHGAGLGDLAVVAARRVGLLEMAFALVVAGGVMRHPAGLLARAVHERVLEAAPYAVLTQSPFEPAVGALFLALEFAGVAVGDAVRRTAAESLPGSALFHT